jgi:diguanylate cyclase (GGDEF)-like protein
MTGSPFSATQGHDYDEPLSGVQAQQELVTQLRAEEDGLRGELDRLRREHDSLVELAYHDAVSGLANRRAFDRELEREWALSSRGTDDSYVVIADLDGFKSLNDSFGHAAGDAVLRQFGSALRKATRSSDVVARIGGDEFGVILVRCDERSLRTFRGRLDGLLAQVVPRPLGVSVGHASLCQSDTAAAALDRADLAMLARKRARHHRRGGRTSLG